ncbi:hypothetical protein HMI54_011804 [Coelomomyces lativittatus]|nr:hypothetical protein HMI54_011804 [Coelomomyces lativittatus]
MFLLFRSERILDNAEELLSFPPPFFQALLKLNELTHQPILLVFISSTVWSLFTRLHPSFQIVFPPYSTNELISIYQRWQPTYDPSLVAFLIHALVDTLHMYMPGLIELHALLQRIYPTLSKKIQDGSVTSSPASLFRAIKQDVTQAPRQLYQGHLMSTYTTDLPELQKYILLASYLASHNASKWDTVYFQKFSEKKRSKAWTSSNSGSASYPVGGGSASVQHGAWFPFERMLPILKAITQEQVVVSMDILPMVAQLVALKYLLQYKSSDMLQPLRLKSQISLSFADSLAQSIAFDLRQCLHQPSAF